MSDVDSRAQGGGSSLRKFFEGAALVLGTLAALAGILEFMELKIVSAANHIDRQDLAQDPESYGYVKKSQCGETVGLNPVVPPEPTPASVPLVDEASRPIQYLTAMIQEGRAIKEHARGIERIGRDKFFKRFDRWRSNSEKALKDADTAIQRLGLPNSEVHADSFDAVTHIRRNVARLPYTSEEYEQFLQEGIEVLARVKGVLQQNGLGLAQEGRPSDSGEEMTGEGH